MGSENGGTTNRRGNVRTELLSAIRIVAKTESQESRERAFHDIASRKILIRTIYKIHKFFRPWWISAIMVAFYGIKSSLVIKIPRGEILATAIFPNEVKHAGFFRDSVGNNRVSLIKYSLKYIFSAETLKFIITSIKNYKKIRRYFRVIYRMNKIYNFMPACRIASVINYYTRFKWKFDNHKNKAVFAASDYAPDAVGLAWAAKSCSIKSIYMSHAFVAPHGFRAPLNFSLSILDGQKMLREYEGRGECSGKAIYKGVEGKYRPMNMTRLKNEGMNIGIFLSAPINIDGLSHFINHIQNSLKPEKILIRMHPVDLINPSIKSCIAGHKNIIVTFGTPMNEDAAQCDMIAIGASSVMLLALKFGVPCIYTSLLEYAKEDYNGFVAGGIVPRYDLPEPSDITAVRDFYLQNWKEKFSEYDYYYAKDIDIQSEIRKAVEELIGK